MVVGCLVAGRDRTQASGMRRLAEVSRREMQLVADIEPTARMNRAVGSDVWRWIQPWL
jgi:hypothetical protein